MGPFWGRKARQWERGRWTCVGSVLGSGGGRSGTGLGTCFGHGRGLAQEQAHKCVSLDGSVVFAHSWANLSPNFWGAQC